MLIDFRFWFWICVDYC